MFGFFKGKKIKKANLGQENAFYFNKDLNRWVERGKEDEAIAEAVPNAPPKIKDPVEQVIQATGIAAKYVDTGFGKPGAVASEYKSPIFDGPNGIKAPSPDMKFFVPTLPVTPIENSAANGGEPQDNDQGEPSRGKEDSPLGRLQLKKFDSSDAKIGKDPLLDIFGPDEDEDNTGSSSDLIGDVDPLDEIFGPQGGSSSPQADANKNIVSTPVEDMEPINSFGYVSNAAPDLTATFGSSVEQNFKANIERANDNPGQDSSTFNPAGTFGVSDQGNSNVFQGNLFSPEVGYTGASAAGVEQAVEPITDLGIMEHAGATETAPYEGSGFQGHTGIEPVTLGLTIENSLEGYQTGGIALDHYSVEDQGGTVNATVPQNMGWNNSTGYGDGQQNGDPSQQTASQVDPSVADFGWTAEETAYFYQWMDERFGDEYKKWSVEDWNGFWQWYNNPVQAEYKEVSTEQVALTELDMGGIAIIADDPTSSGLDNVVSHANEHLAPKETVQNDDTGEPKATKDPLGTFYNEFAPSPLAGGSTNIDQNGALVENVPPGFDSLKPGGNPVASMPGSDEGTQESPVTAEIRSDTLSKSNGSFSSGSQELVIQYDLAQLHDFFAQLGDLLGVLTPGSDELAKQQGDCQEQLRLFMKSLKDHNRISPISDMGSHEAVNPGLQDQELTGKLEDAEQEVNALRLDLEKCRTELSEAKESMELLISEHKEAQDHAVTTLRTELEQSYHHRLVSLQQELDSKASEIAILQASRVPVTSGENSHQGGDLQKLREALEEMEISRNQEIADLQYELDMKVAENDDIQHELDTLKYKITHGLPLGGELTGLVPQIEFREMEESSTEIQALKQTISELRDSYNREKEEVIRLTGSLDEANKNLASAERELETVQEQGAGIQALKPVNSAEYPPKKLMVSLGLAELKIKALSGKLHDMDEDVDALMCQALGEFVEYNGRL